MLAKGKNLKIFILSGPSGSGKTTLLKQLFKDAGIRKSFLKGITATTRGPREGEKHGRDYLFLSPKEFLAKRRQGDFLETKNVAGRLYGSPKEFLQKAFAQNKHFVVSVDVRGAMEIQRQYPDRTVLIFVFPPSFAELERRLLARTTEDAQTVKKRLRLAKKEVKYAQKYHYWVENKTVSRAKKLLKEILQVESLRRTT